jgi:hypothetical protein
MPDLITTEAVELLPPLIIAVAGETGARALVIKGRALSDQRLRAPRISGDVDVLVDPALFNEVSAALAARGWEDRDGKVLGRVNEHPGTYAMHSLTLLHESWPVAVDLHRFYPGFLDSPRAVFEKLWSERATSRFGSVGCPVPGRLDHWLLAMLHMSRSPHPAQTEQLMESAYWMTPTEKSELIRRAVTLAAIDPLRPYLQRLGLRLPPPDSRHARWLSEWEEAISSRAHGDLALLDELLRTSGTARLWSVWRAMFPPEHTFRLFHDVRPGRMGLLGAYFLRLGHGLLRIPRMTRYALRMRRGG